MNEEIHQFLEALAIVRSTRNFCNQYSSERSVISIRRNNLRLYLKQMAKLKPKILLIGEAPGYRGCRLTGVPFTSEYILFTGLEQLGLFGESRLNGNRCILNIEDRSQELGVSESGEKDFDPNVRELPLIRIYTKGLMLPKAIAT